MLFGKDDCWPKASIAACLTSASSRSRLPRLEGRCPTRMIAGLKPLWQPIRHQNWYSLLSETSCQFQQIQWKMWSTQQGLQNSSLHIVWLMCKHFIQDLLRKLCFTTYMHPSMEFILVGRPQLALMLHMNPVVPQSGFAFLLWRFLLCALMDPGLNQIILISYADIETVLGSMLLREFRGAYAWVKGDEPRIL